MSFNTTVKTEKGINNLKQAGNDFKSAAESAADDLSDRMVQKASDAGARVRHYVEDASEYVNEATTRAKQVGHEIEDSIRSKPVQSSIIALCAGVVLGMLLRK